MAISILATVIIISVYNAITHDYNEEEYYREQVLNIDDAAYEYCIGVLGDNASYQVIWGFYNLNRATCDSVSLANMN